jgi:hypothetical protein
MRLRLALLDGFDLVHQHLKHQQAAVTSHTASI